MRHYLLVILLLLGSHTFAQPTIFAGRVTDAHRQGIPYAVVQVKDRNEGVYADDDGRFSFTADAATVKALIVSCLGFERAVIPITTPPTDSLRIQLTPKTNRLKEVAIIASKGDKKTDILGKPRNRLPYEGDCYRNYGAETAILLRGDTTLSATLKEVYVYVTGEGAPLTRFRIHVYQYGTLPTTELTDSNIIASAGVGNTWVKVDLSKLHIPVGKGLFVSVEWVAGLGNARYSLQSILNPEVTNYNGQVLGLTTGYGKPSKTYMRLPFNPQWQYYDSPDAQRKGGYFLNPMIYCTYTYYE